MQIDEIIILIIVIKNTLIKSLNIIFCNKMQSIIKSNI